MSDATTRKGHCFCEAVEVTVDGDPVGMGYCHCSDCREWSAGPVNAFTLWPAGTVQIAKGAEHVGRFNKTDNSVRKWCAICGGHLLTEHPVWGLVDVYAAILPDVAFKAGIHVNYGESVLPMKDGLPKQRGFPAELGGTGELIAE